MDTPKVRTGLGKSDCPGSQGGCRKRGLFKEVRAPAFYPDRRTEERRTENEERRTENEETLGETAHFMCTVYFMGVAFI